MNSPDIICRNIIAAYAPPDILRSICLSEKAVDKSENETIYENTIKKYKGITLEKLRAHVIAHGPDMSAATFEELNRT